MEEQSKRIKVSPETTLTWSSDKGNWVILALVEKNEDTECWRGLQELIPSTVEQEHYQYRVFVFLYKETARVTQRKMRTQIKRFAKEIHHLHQQLKIKCV